jgi:hypothetical protein
MKERVAKENRLVRRVKRIEEALTKSKKRPDPFKCLQTLKPGLPHYDPVYLLLF